MISAHSNHANFLDYIDRAKLVDSQTVFVFSVGGLDTSQYLLIEIGRICPKLEHLLSRVHSHAFLLCLTNLLSQTDQSNLPPRVHSHAFQIFPDKKFNVHHSRV